MTKKDYDQLREDLKGSEAALSLLSDAVKEVANHVAAIRAKLVADHVAAIRAKHEKPDV